MLLQALEQPILVDGKPFMKNLQLNLVPENRQLRLKTDFLEQPGTSPPQSIDIVVYNYSDIKLDGLSLAISIDGQELLRSVTFRAKLSYDFLKGKWKLVGSWNGWPIERSFKEIVEILSIIKELAMR